MPASLRVPPSLPYPRIGSATVHGAYAVLSAAQGIPSMPDDTVGLIVERHAAGDDSLHLWLGRLTGLEPRPAIDARIILAATREGAPPWLTGITGIQAVAPSTLTALINSLMVGLVGLPAPSDTDDTAVVIDAILLMARQVWDRPPEPDAPDWAKGDAEMVEAARLVEARLLDPELCADTLMVALGLSRSSLYRAFRPVGGVQAYIRQRRLENARDVLAARVGARPTVGEVAHTHGFASDSHFSRAFRKTFGYPPGSSPD